MRLAARKNTQAKATNPKVSAQVRPAGMGGSKRRHSTPARAGAVQSSPRSRKSSAAMPQPAEAASSRARPQLRRKSVAVAAAEDIEESRRKRDKSCAICAKNPADSRRDTGRRN